MIKLGKVTVSDGGNNSAKLACPITIDDQSEIIWFTVDNTYKDYLCYERSDAFVVGVLGFALKYGHSISFETPLSEKLCYQLQEYLIPALCQNVPQYHFIELLGETSAEELPNAGAVATGISCGVDSFHVLTNHLNTGLPSHQLTHLTFFNVGSHGFGAKAEELYQKRLTRSRRFAQEYHLPLIECSSNLHNLLGMTHLYYHTYLSGFAILAMQKLYAIYYYASSDRICDFNIASEDPSFYESLLLGMWSTYKTTLYSDGPNVSRLEKTAVIGDFEPAFRYLNVCTAQDENCGLCEKCRRTILSLAAAGKLHHFKSVFDVAYYEQHKLKYTSYLYAQYLLKQEYYVDIYPAMKHEVTLRAKIKGFFRYIRKSLHN